MLNNLNKYEPTEKFGVLELKRNELFFANKNKIVA